MKSSENKVSVPTILVVLGATGDLMAKKIVPALFHLHGKKALPEHFRLLGVSRREWTDGDFAEHVKKILAEKVSDAPPAAAASFLELVSYHKLVFDAPDDYAALAGTLKKIDDAWGVCANKLFYLSVPPQFYFGIFENINRAHLADGCGLPRAGESDTIFPRANPESSRDESRGGRGECWTRIIVEKPFGSDEASAKKLDAQLAKLFREEQIYRIDHYLAKEAFQNVLTFRFFNNLFEDQWGSGLIERVTVREYETIGVEDRGPFYDGVGTLRDVGQNHLLQMVALATMDAPKKMDAENIRAARAEILEKLVPLSPADVKAKTFRAQYDGYQAIKGVAPDSQTETYFRAEFSIAHPRWHGVRFVMEAGKRLGPPRSPETTEIEVVFKHLEPCLCAQASVEPRSESAALSERGSVVRHLKNILTFRQDPKEGITLKFWAKKPDGKTTDLEERTLEFDLAADRTRAQYAGDYAKLLLDCIEGDQTLFVSSAEIAAMWRFIDPIVDGWQKNLAPLHRYAPDSPAVTKEAEAAMGHE